jgi:hypothetical protein
VHTIRVMQTRVKGNDLDTDMQLRYPCASLQAARGTMSSTSGRFFDNRWTTFQKSGRASRRGSVLPPEMCAGGLEVVHGKDADSFKCISLPASCINNPCQSRQNPDPLQFVSRAISVSGSHSQ